MSRAADEFRQVDYLIELAMEGAITPDQAQELNALILTHPAVCRHYCEYVQLTMNIERLSAKLPVTDLNEYTTVFDQALWDQLAHEEMSAPVMELPQAGPAQRPVSPAAQKTARPKNKFRIVAAMSSAAAAVVFLVLFARFAPVRPGIEVATVSDCMDAKGKVGSFEIGSRVTNRLWPIDLTSGYLKLTFDYGAEVILEGPAEFQILSAEQMRLLQGKLTAVVPREAVGFRVDTPGASVIDLGTEFSLEVEQDGSTSVHLFEGNASLVAGKPGNRQSCPITAGQAKQIDSQSGKIEDIPLTAGHFVRRFDSRRKTVWRQLPRGVARTRAAWKHLVGYWSMDDPASAGAVPFGNPVFDSVDKPPIPGNLCALVLDGRSGLNTMVNGISGTAARTLSAWVKVEKGTAGGTLLSWGMHKPGVRFGTRATFKIDQSGLLRFEISDSYAIGTAAVADGKWHHVAMVSEDGNSSTAHVRFYVDGIPDPISDVNDAHSINSELAPISIGYSQEFYNAGWKHGMELTGRIDEVCVFAKALSAEEIAMLANL
jgi:hypothetical protein